MRLVSFARHAAPAAILFFASAVVLTGCSNNRPEQNPFLIEKFAQIDESLKDVARIKRELVILQDDLKFLGEEINNLRTASGGLTPAQQEQLAATITKLEEMQRVADSLERATSASATQVAAAAGAPASAPSSSAPAPAAAATGSTPAPRPVTASAAPRPSAPAPQASASRPRPAAPAASASRPATSSNSGARRGFYYTVKAGDSLTTVAQGNGTSQQALAQANRLPNGAALIPGQRLWVP